MEWSKYNYLYYSNIAKGYLLYSSLSNAFIKLENEGAELVEKVKESQDFSSMPEGLYKTLKEKKFIVDSNETETNMIVLQTLTKRFNTKTLSITIAPTQVCNFDCPYCYETNKAGAKMSVDVQNRIVEYVKGNNELKGLAVVWYGGEPTLAIDIIEKLSNELMPCVDNYSAYMVTNGYLLDKIVDKLEGLKISGLQITLDGTAQTHDKTRCLRNGKPTFDHILENLDLLTTKCPNVDVSIRMNISRDNSQEYVSLNKVLGKRYHGKRVHLYPAFVFDYTGCSSSCYEDCCSKASFLKELYYNHGVITNPIYPRRTGKGCMAQTLNSFVIGPDGELYKCWNDLGDKKKSVGNIMNAQCITNHQLLADMMISNDVIYDEECKNCVLFPSCYGGCSAHRKMKADYCIPAKSSLGDYLDIKYLQWQKMQEYNRITK